MTIEGTLEPYMVIRETSSKFLDGMKGLHRIITTITTTTTTNNVKADIKISMI